MPNLLKDRYVCFADPPSVFVVFLSSHWSSCPDRGPSFHQDDRTANQPMFAHNVNLRRWRVCWCRHEGASKTTIGMFQRDRRGASAEMQEARPCCLWVSFHVLSFKEPTLNLPPINKSYFFHQKLPKFIFIQVLNAAGQKRDRRQDQWPVTPGVFGRLVTPE